MQIGYARNVITPGLDKPVYLAGFGQNRRAETIHDELTSRALALRDENQTLVLVALDVIGFFRQDVYDVIRRVQEQTSEVSKTSKVSPQIIMASIHNHHGPDTMGLWGPDTSHSGVDPEYMDWLKDKTGAAILSALNNMKPTSGVKATSVHVPGLAKNARNPEIVDDELVLLQFLNTDNYPLSTVFNFPCHPEVLWEHNPHITADYVCALRREVEAATGAPCIFFAGALGGMMTPDVKDHSFEEAEFMGKRLAEEGLKALESAAISHLPSAISIQKKEVSVKLTNILFKFAFGRKLLPDARDKRGYITTEVNLLKIGPLWFATIPGELLPKLGMELKAEMRKAGAEVAGIISLANDELGYILPKEEFRYPLNPLNPGKHYEETMSIGKEMGPTVMQAVRELLQP
ncbi:MAG: neutral/alkaline non-lysosomal ceramidase N-terminal domain-containing protein [Anaerolineales bacterium]|nr:neutral/alkaline non-lysosomal ceramidase N-terminal domain-containing protein [Anaerolineales bacterium]